MGKTHWKKLTNPNYLGAYALEPGEEPIYTIKEIKREIVTGQGGNKEDCPVLYFHEDVKPLILNSTNFKNLERRFNSKFVEDWIGGKIQLYNDPTVRFGKEVVGGLRIRPRAPVDESTAEKCAQCGNPVKPYKSMTAEQVAAYTQENTGRIICMECAFRAANKENESEAEES